jgi:hypothetical protein
MGLLDDAIREHLDLKRRSGADPAEIERAEREALGPVRRERAPLAVGDEHDGPDLRPHPVDDPVNAPRPAKRRGLRRRSRGDVERIDVVEPEFEDHEPLVRVQPMRRPEPSDDDQRPDRAGQPLHDDEPLGSDLDLDDPQDPPRLRIESPADIVEPPTSSPEPSTPPPLGDAQPAVGAVDETAEFNIEATFAAEPAGEDVLEETPEFLQDTPDHDRLWFEQRPPRDFDFDG